MVWRLMIGSVDILLILFLVVMMMMSGRGGVLICCFSAQVRQTRGLADSEPLVRGPGALVGPLFA